jgi:hypothetical protein
MTIEVTFLCYLAFLANLTILLREIVRSRFCAEQIVSDAQRTARTRMPWQTVLMCVAAILAYFVAYRYADLSVVWLCRAIMALTSSSLWYVLKAAAAASPDFVPSSQPPDVAQAARQLRWWSTLSVVETVVWIYAWRHLFEW